ncbi:hypothetical protein FACS1894164_20700 [Spirochaetia bacterium]|nr:hypothetical protein FACS1894164_20700 [Spirochaetia bacterium]
MKENAHLRAIPADILAQVQSKINEALMLLKPYTVQLTPVERREILKMGEKTLAFVEKAHDLAKQNPAFCPSYLDMNEFDIDFEDAHGLWTPQNMAQQLKEAIDDTEMVSGSESYHHALIFYNAVKAAAAQDVFGAKAVYEELRSRFPHKGRPKSSNAESSV